MNEGGGPENNLEGRPGKALSHVATGGDVKACLDRAKMAQVLHNLVSNGLKFTPPGGHVTVIVTLEDGPTLPLQTPRGSYIDTSPSGISVTVPGGRAHNTLWVKISVTDTGVGMSQVEFIHFLKS